MFQRVQVCRWRREWDGQMEWRREWTGESEGGARLRNERGVRDKRMETEIEKRVAGFCSLVPLFQIVTRLTFLDS